MKIHGMLLVKNEADIIEWSLRESCKHFDHIYVLDNGSEDGTWELVREVARANPQVVPFEVDRSPFSDALRAKIFNRYRQHSEEGDWWCRFDADEIFVSSPRTLLQDVAGSHSVVWGLFLNYMMTPAEAEKLLRQSPDSPPKINVTNCPRYYRKDYVHSEAMFFKHRHRLVWNQGSWPSHMGLVSPLRPLVKHFRYRSAQQIMLRLATRQSAAAAGWPNFAHEMESSWKEKLCSETELWFDADDGNYSIDFRNAPEAREPFSRLLMKRFLHGTRIWP
jgi:glycosyltransferase involved in cell wall biosynthesis